MFRVKLPLAAAKGYNRYHLTSWPVPYKKDGYTIQILTQKPDMAIHVDPAIGRMFIPTNCQGWSPSVCRGNLLKCTTKLFSCANYR